MNVGFRHIITLIITSLISFVANTDMSYVASRFSDGHIVDYQYDAGGKRLGAYYLLASDDVFNDGIGVEGGGVSIQELVREWSGEFVYENGELERILTDNGYWKNGRYWFYIKDWQGNNRVTVGGISDASATSSGGMLNNPTLLQAKDVNVYYPYGTRFSDVFATTTDRYQYSGKEFDRMNGLDLYDFHARQYDPVLGRFTTPDPLSEKYYHLSPYAYCASNPLRYIDPTGMEIFINDENCQKEFKLSMLDVFNIEIVNSLVFEDDGKLSCRNSNVIDLMSDCQKKLFDGIKRLMESDEETIIKYANNYIHNDNSGNKQNINVISDYGGGLYDSSNKTIVIAPIYKGSFETYSDDISTGFEKLTINTTTTAILFHEIAERFIGANPTRGEVIDYENIVRDILNIEKRPYDTNHSYKINTISQ